MFGNSTVPLTIIKEKNEDATVTDYKWKKTLLSPEILKYVVENITLVQEPTETLSLDITLLQTKSKCKPDSLTNCTNCGIRSLSTGQANQIVCPFCREYCTRYTNVTSVCDCPKNGGNLITYDLTINFDNYLHEFTENYSYEVTCKILKVKEPDECLFSCTELRLNNTIVFKKCYASTVYGEEFNMSNLDLYFCIRRLDKRNSEMSLPTMLSFRSVYRNSEVEDRKVILQAKNGQVTAHKSVLSHFSDVFRATFAHEMKEKQEGVVKISDFDCKVVQKMVDYLYTGKLGKVTEIVQDLFKLAHQYQLYGLCRCCEEYYMFNFDLDNDHIVEILQLADLYELAELKNSAEKFIRRYEKDLSKLPSYQKHLCQTITIEKAANTLIFADKYAIVDVKTCALDFIKLNFKKMVESNDFVKLFKSNPSLMEEVYVYFCKEKE